MNCPGLTVHEPAGGRAFHDIRPSTVEISSSPANCCLGIIRLSTGKTGTVAEAGGTLMDNVENEISDERLINETLRGDDEAFALLVARYKRRVFSLASRFARDRDELEDISQEVFIKAYENLKSFRREAPFEHWLSRIAVRACYDFLRRIRREKFHTPLENLVYELKDQSHEARQAAREAHELLAWAMSKMRPEERLIITLLELEEKPVREIAELTGWSEAKVKVRAFRARQALKTILEKTYER